VPAERKLPQSNGARVCRKGSIVEVGLSNIGLYDGRNLIIVVRIKLIDARTGSVLGKSSEVSLPSIEPFETLFDNRAQRFKDISKERKILAERNLKAIGLIPWSRTNRLTLNIFLSVIIKILQNRF
jgi:hypothetical protein